MGTNDPLKISNTVFFDFREPHIEKVQLVTPAAGGHAGAAFEVALVGGSFGEWSDADNVNRAVLIFHKDPDCSRNCFDMTSICELTGVWTHTEVRCNSTLPEGKMMVAVGSQVSGSVPYTYEQLQAPPTVAAIESHC